MSAKINWGKITLISFLATAGLGAYELTNFLIDRGNVDATRSSVDEMGVERRIIGPNMYSVSENGFVNTFNFASQQLVSKTEKSETITLFNIMDNAPYIARSLSEACNVATQSVTQLEGMSTWSLLPWRVNRFTAAQETARSFIANHCPTPAGAKP